jgi:hypothetical protein
MRPNQCNVPRSRLGVVMWNVLFDCKPKVLFVSMLDRSRTLAYALSANSMRDDAEMGHAAFGC